MASIDDVPTLRASVVGEALGLSPGTRVADYEVGAVLARGGMATVYEVRHRDGTPYALKVLDPALVQDKPVSYRRMLFARLRREAEIQARLRHPNVVHVYELIKVAGLPALVMDLVDGPTLASLWSEQDLTWEDVGDIGEGLLRALQAAHVAGVIHRDVKPANLLIDRSDGRYRARLTDFGLAKAPAEDEELTQTGQVMGTVGYMPATQGQCAKHVDERADLFSAGAVLYELVSGRPLARYPAPADEEAVRGALEDLERRRHVPAAQRRAIRLALLAEEGLDAGLLWRTWRGEPEPEVEEVTERLPRRRAPLRWPIRGAIALGIGLLAGWLLF